ncbi:ABC transporter permease [Actinosynnema sp. CS-041913]|uniref:ABC transporter permease n=1 Tax=Actinosynnema sp. CS-041913 TaxID=3239917 RepID=UPI003D8E3F07
MTTATDHDRKTRGFATATKLIAEREMKTFLRSKGFWIGLGVIVIGLFAMSILPTVLGGDRTKVVAVGAKAAEVLAGADVEVRTVADVPAAEALVRSEDVKAAIVPADGNSVTGVRVIALADPPTDVLAALRTAPPVDLLDPSEVGQGQRRLVIMVFGFIFLVFGMGGTAIAQSTVTEKQTRIVEILVSTVPVRALLAGKIAGHALLTVGQALVLAVAAPIALRLGGHSDLLTLVAPALGWFVPFLILGFVLLASMWAVAGALVSRQEDLGSSMGPVIMLVLGPYFGVTFFADNATVLTVLSFVPFSSAIAMPVRMFAGQAAAWEALVALGLLAGTVVLIVLLASRLYSGSLLHTGGKLGLAKAWAREE